MWKFQRFENSILIEELNCKYLGQIFRSFINCLSHWKEQKTDRYELIVLNPDGSTATLFISNPRKNFKNDQDNS